MTHTTTNDSAQFGYEILRDFVLPSILGRHEEDILYWSGKEIARKFPLQEQAEIIQFFARANWGHLTVTKETKNEMLFTLSPAMEPSKLINRTYSIEAGFIAEQLQQMNRILTECHPTVKEKDTTILLQVKWDRKTIIE